MNPAKYKLGAKWRVTRVTSAVAEEYARSLEEKHLSSLVTWVVLGDWGIIIPTNKPLQVRLLGGI